MLPGPERLGSTVVPVLQPAVAEAHARDVRIRENFHRFLRIRMTIITGKQNVNRLRKCPREWQFCALFYTLEPKGKTRGVTCYPLAIGPGGGRRRQMAAGSPGFGTKVKQTRACCASAGTGWFAANGDPDDGNTEGVGGLGSGAVLMTQWRPGGSGKQPRALPLQRDGTLDAKRP